MWLLLIWVFIYFRIGTKEKKKEEKEAKKEVAKKKKVMKKKTGMK